MKKQIIMNAVYGASAMAGIIAVSKMCKLAVDKFAKHGEEEIAEESE
jgi:hypothetical protein